VVSRPRCKCFTASFFVVLSPHLARHSRGDPATIAGIAACTLFIVGCGSPGPAPSPPTPVQPPPAVTAAPVARLGVTIDSRGSAAAIQNLSEVTLDASGSSGTGLQFGLDFGDGQGADQAVATHVYTASPRAFKARAIVTDWIGRSDSVAVYVTVKDVIGSWYNEVLNPANHRYEFRTLLINSHTARNIIGVYTHPEGNNTAFAGALTGPRGLEVTLTDGTIVFTSGADGGFDSDTLTLVVHVRGGSANGQTLTFTRTRPYSD
jgi:hypothetical protein